LRHRNDGDRCADFDIARYGMEVFRNSPRQADLMIVAVASAKDGAGPSQVYDQMMEPSGSSRWCVRVDRGTVQQLRHRPGVDQIVPSTSTRRVAASRDPNARDFDVARTDSHGEIMKRRHEGRPVHLDATPEL